MELLTPNEVARILGVDVGTVRRWAKKGAINFVELPHANKRMQIRIRRETLDRILTSVVVERRAD
jgi:excisionase family DNA binding protein